MCSKNKITCKIFLIFAYGENAKFAHTTRVFRTTLIRHNSQFENAVVVLSSPEYVNVQII